MKQCWEETRHEPYRVNRILWGLDWTGLWIEEFRRYLLMVILFLSVSFVLGDREDRDMGGSDGPGGLGSVGSEFGRSVGGAKALVADGSRVLPLSLHG